MTEHDSQENNLISSGFSREANLSLYHVFSPSPRSSPRDQGEADPYADMEDKSRRAVL
jgi:hypothetical protein